MVLNSAVGRFHSFDLNHYIRGLGIFLLKEQTQGTVDFKSLLPPAKELRESKGIYATLKKRENFTWKFSKKTLEKSWNFVIMEKWEP